jgi:hypothetical protein
VLQAREEIAHPLIAAWRRQGVKGPRAIEHDGGTQHPLHRERGVGEHVAGLRVKASTRAAWSAGAGSVDAGTSGLSSEARSAAAASRLSGASKSADRLTRPARAPKRRVDDSPGRRTARAWTATRSAAGHGLRSGSASTRRNTASSCSSSPSASSAHWQSRSYSAGSRVTALADMGEPRKRGRETAQCSELRGRSVRERGMSSGRPPGACRRQRLTCERPVGFGRIE